MLRSMTGISTLSGSSGPYDWSMELRGVNNKGLDIRARVPEWLVGLDQEVRKTISSVIKRGSIQFNLKISLSDGVNDRKIDLERLDNILSNVATISKVAEEKGLVISPISLTDISVQHGFIDFESSEEHKVSVTKAIISHLPRLIEDFQKVRSAEGKTLQKVLQSGVIKMERHLTACSAAIAKRPLEFKVSFEKAIQNLKQEIQPDRLAQELAILAVKSDVTEEIDRLKAHIDAANTLLKSHNPVGRKFDFLMQEFNRETNTLCAKSNSKELTAIGIEMKVTIDQMREQVQNVE